MLFVLENWREGKSANCTLVFGQSTSLLKKKMYVSYLNVSKINLQLLFSLSLFTQSHGLGNSR